MERYKLIPFDISKAKTPQNPKGLEVVTKYGTAVTIVSTDFRSSQQYFDGGSLYPILAVVHGKDCDMSALYGCDGEIGDDYSGDDLCLKEPISQRRRMTHKELSWWLIENPEEHREWKLGKFIENSFCYEEDLQDNEVDETILIRSNGGEWREPLI